MKKNCYCWIIVTALLLSACMASKATAQDFRRQLPKGYTHYAFGYLPNDPNNPYDAFEFYVNEKHPDSGFIGIVLIPGKALYFLQNRADNYWPELRVLINKPYVIKYIKKAWNLK